MNDVSLEAYKEHVDAPKAWRLREAIVRLLEAKSLTARQVAEELKESYHDVERICSDLLMRGVLARGRKARNSTGARAYTLLVVPEALVDFTAQKLPDRRPSRRELEVAVLREARRVEQAWRGHPDPPAGLMGLLEAVWDLDHADAYLDAAKSREREPWGSPRRIRLAELGYWLRQNGERVPIEAMNDHHLRSALEWCLENKCPLHQQPSRGLYGEMRRRGFTYEVN